MSKLELDIFNSSTKYRISAMPSLPLQILVAAISESRLSMHSMKGISRLQYENCRLLKNRVALYILTGFRKHWRKYQSSFADLLDIMAFA